MTNIIRSFLIIVAVAAVAGGATYSYFNDAETSTGNTFTAGSLDLQMNADSGFSSSVDALFAVSGMEPGVTTASKTLYFRNSGTVDGKVKFNVSYAENDIAPQTGEFANINVNASAFAKKLIVTTSVTDGVDVRPYWVSQVAALNGGLAAAKTNGAIGTIGGVDYPTVYGLSTVTLYSGPVYQGGNADHWAQNVTKQTTLGFTLDPLVDNRYQFDGVNVTLTAEMQQYTSSASDFAF